MDRKRNRNAGADAQGADKARRLGKIQAGAVTEDMAHIMEKRETICRFQESKHWEAEQKRTTDKPGRSNKQ